MSSSDNDSSVPDELASDMSEEGQLGMQQIGEEGEDDYDDEMASEEGEQDMSESEEEEAAPKKRQEGEPESTAAEGDINDDVVDDDLATNIETNRDQAIRHLLAKEDLGIIQMRIKETIRILANFKDLCQKNKSRQDYVEQLKSDINQSYDYNMDILELLFDLFSPQHVFDFIEANEN